MKWQAFVAIAQVIHGLVDETDTANSTLNCAASSSLLQGGRGKMSEPGEFADNSAPDESEDDSSTRTISAAEEKAFETWMKEEAEDERENELLAERNAHNDSSTSERSDTAPSLAQNGEGSQWAWYQKTPGCHCDVHNRRRNEKARLHHNDEHYYFIQTNLGGRRRASIQGCHCEHESTLGKGVYCPARWWAGGSQYCHCYDEFVERGTHNCIPRCKFEVGKIVGSWQHVTRVVTNDMVSYSYGTSFTEEVTESQEWTKTVENTVESSVSVGFEVEGLSASSSLTVSNTVGKAFTRAQARTIGIEQSSQTTEQWSTANLEFGSHLWQWQIAFYNKCGDLVSTTSTNVRAVSTSRQRLPCCIATWFEMDGSCTPGYDMFSLSTRPDHCKGMPQCNDNHYSCGDWKPFCTSGQWQNWMAQNCKRTCDKCR